ncbi:MAG: hybrid sensor histidine kinase/response regulator [Acetobacteraceae bacterium]|nr:hybrid sensor histidine kinase/response regulator [Acetobacteraceae bacterium]
MDELLADFLTETNESLAELDVALLTLERTPDDANTLSLIFRMVHTIKGTCGFLGLPRLERVAHAGENVLGKLRDGALSASPDIVTQILAALDRIKAILSSLGATGDEPAGDDTELIASLNAAASGQEPSNTPTAPALEPPVHAEFAEPPDHVAEAVQEAPVSHEPDPAHEPMAAEDPDSHSVHGPGGQAPAVQQTIRVTVDVLEDLMTLVSELVLTRNQLLQLARAQENSGFTAPLQRLSHITSDLQEGVMKTRMQPIGMAWNKLPRLVRDLSRDLGKKIELTMLGAETELDRQVLELIKDPLTHMVRNSGDHGLETPAERRAAGKPETGQIVLNAFHEGGHIVIEISDDGRGLAAHRIRQKILTNGLATEAELAAMPEVQIQRFIFRAGFSTAANVTAVSGRGVGMDVVKTNIEKIGGTIDLKSIAGQGTAFTIKIPLTLAIVSALIVEAASERFAIPQISVVELVRARRAGDGTRSTPGENAIERINDTPVLRLRDRLLPLVSLSDLLGLGKAETPESGAHIVVTQVGASLLGIIVDRVFDTEEIVVKPVAPILRHITMFSGNTILGDGSVIMILDPAGIARATGVGAAADNKLVKPETIEGTASADRMALLLFRVNGSERMAVPLNLVARLEDIPREKIEFSSGIPVTQYRGRLMPLVSLTTQDSNSTPTQSLLVFADGDHAMGLMVDEIIDVVEDRMEIELASARPGSLGTAVIGGFATDVLDTGYWLTQAGRDWFSARSARSSVPGSRVLVVEDSAFFRNLLVPSLAAAGFKVSTAANAEEALRLRDAGLMFDAIVSDIEMPGMDGLSFARAVREGGPWANLPMIALSSHTEPHHVEAGRDAGFTDYVAKTQRGAIANSLRQCLTEMAGA